ncbi:hypothetical protein [Kitasatospora sp. NPDC059803]|uniref:hypothetical protein n=1 Tax=Kitasatospora sp. NPDC059803 TaxID=3346953 RepID=UPI00366339CC
MPDLTKPKSAGVITPTLVIPAGEPVPPRPPYPPLTAQDLQESERLTEPAHNPEPDWFTKLRDKALAHDITTLPARPQAEPVEPWYRRRPSPPVEGGPDGLATVMPEVSATVTVTTKVPPRPSSPPPPPVPCAGAGGGGDCQPPNGTGVDANPERPTNPAGGGSCGACAFQCGAVCNYPADGQAPVEAEPVEQEVKVEVTVGEPKEAKEPQKRKRRLPDILHGTPSGTATGWHGPRVRWTLKWLAPGIAGWGLNGLHHIEHVIVWFHDPGTRFWAGAAFVAAGGWVAWRTRGWWPPLAWVLRIPMATAILAAALTPLSH